MGNKLVVYVKPFTEGHRRAIAQAAEAHGYRAVFCDTLDQAVMEAAEAEILFSPERSLPAVAPRLKWLCVSSAGAEQYLDPAIYANPDAMLTNSSGAYGVTLAEHVVMVTLELMRRQPEYADMVRRRVWDNGLTIHSVRGSRVTLLGTGDIGCEVARRLRGFAPRDIVGVNRRGGNPGGLFDRAVPLAELDARLPETDLLVMSLPGTPETVGLMDARRLKLLPEDAFLVNVGRGSAIDQSALNALMRAGHLAGAALDVFEREPLPADDPLWECPRLLITPHCAGNMTLGYTTDRIVDLFIEDLDNYCAGRPLRRLVDRKAGY